MSLERRPFLSIFRLSEFQRFKPGLVGQQWNRFHIASSKYVSPRDVPLQLATCYLPRLTATNLLPESISRTEKYDFFERYAL